MRWQDQQGVPRIGVALSGGSLKAAAHVGVLAALEQAGIRPHRVAGTSAGSVVATLYAHGYTVEELMGLVEKFPGPALLDFGFPVTSSILSVLKHRLLGKEMGPALPNGLLRGSRLLHYLQELVQDKNPVMPYYVIATDLRSGIPVTLTNDRAAVAAGIAFPVQDVAKALLGSCSIPGILSPVPLGPWLLVDGAFRHYVPVKVLRQVNCTKLIAVNLHHLDEDWEPQTFVHVLARSFEIMLKETIDNDVEGPDLLVLEPRLKATWWSFREMRRYVEEGQRVVRDRRPQLERFMRAPYQNGPRVIFHRKPEA